MIKCNFKSIFHSFFFMASVHQTVQTATAAMSELRLAVELIWTGGTRQRSAGKCCRMMTRWTPERVLRSCSWWSDIKKKDTLGGAQVSAELENLWKVGRTHCQFHRGNTVSEFCVSTVRTWLFYRFQGLLLEKFAPLVFEGSLSSEDAPLQRPNDSLHFFLVAFPLLS